MPNLDSDKGSTVTDEQVIQAVQEQFGVTEQISVYPQGTWYTYEHEGRWYPDGRVTRELSYHLTSDGRLFSYCSRTCHIKGHTRLEKPREAQSSSCSPTEEQRGTATATLGCDHIQEAS